MCFFPKENKSKSQQIRWVKCRFSPTWKSLKLQEGGNLDEGKLFWILNKCLQSGVYVKDNDDQHICVKSEASKLE